MDPYAPDQLTLELLGAEHQNGTWIGRELLPIASRMRNLGGSEDDYRRWVLSSNLWTTYVSTTSDSAKKQDNALDGAWWKAEENGPFDLEDALTDLAGRIAAHTGWAGAAGSRNRAVALALVDFCIEHNCFTRTLSSYELAKWTAGQSPRSVARALVALTDLGLIREVERTDRRTSTRSTRRYRVNLQWRGSSTAAPPTPNKGVSNIDARSTGIASLSQFSTPPSDLWSRKGLGPGAQRVFEVLTDEPTTARRISELTGIKVPGVKRYLTILADHCLAGTKPGARGEATLYFRVDTPLEAVADALGIRGYVDTRRSEIEQRQAANRAYRPSAYGNAETIADSPQDDPLDGLGKADALRGTGLQPDPDGPDWSRVLPPRAKFEPAYLTLPGGGPFVD